MERDRSGTQFLRVFVLLVLCQASVRFVGAENSGVEFAQLQSLYQGKVAEVDEAESGKKKTLLGRFADAVVRIQEDAQSSGDLNLAVEAKREIDAARAGKLLDRNPENADLPEKLARAREIAGKEISEIGGEANDKRLTLANQYLGALENCRTNLTKEGKLEDALAVSEEIKSITAKIGEMDQAGGGSNEPREVPLALTKNLRVYFSFDSDEKELKNEADPRIKGVLEGSTYVEEGRIRGARRFNGVSDRIALDGDLPDSTELTVAMWVKYNSAGNGGGLLCDYGPKSGNDLMYGLISGNAVEIRADKEGATLRKNVPLPADISDSWHHLVWVLGRKESVIYLDGKKVGQVEEEGSNKGQHDGYLAYSHVGGSFRYFPGEIDEIMIWTNALEEGEVKMVYDMK